MYEPNRTEPNRVRIAAGGVGEKGGWWLAARSVSFFQLYYFTVFLPTKISFYVYRTLIYLEVNVFPRIDYTLKRIV